MKPTQCATLSEHEIHVWRFPLIAARQEMTAIGHWLGEAERETLARLGSPTDRDKRLVAWGRLRYILSRYLSCSPHEIGFERKPSGHPEIVRPQNAQLRFSLSHSGSFGLVGVSASDVGVDIERMRDTIDTMRLARRFYAAGELETVSRQPEAEREKTFFRLWVHKEAYLKSVGSSVPSGLSQCEIALDAEGPRLLRSSFDSQEAMRSLVDIPVSKGYVAALAVCPQVTDVSVFDL